MRRKTEVVPLFDDGEDTFLDAMVEILDIMPEPWWSTTWEGLSKVYEDEPDGYGRAIFVRQEREERCEEDANSFHLSSVAQGARSLKE